MQLVPPEVEERLRAMCPRKEETLPEPKKDSAIYKIVCINCRISFSSKFSQQIYCSRKCKIRAQAKREGRQPRKPVTRCCEICSEVFDTLYPTKAYCSERCKDTAVRRRNGIKSRPRRNWEEGKRFTRLILVERAGTTSNGRQLWLCDCDCGTKKFIARADKLKNGSTVSCGCYRLEQMKLLTDKRKLKDRNKQQQKLLAIQHRTEQQIEKDKLIREARQVRQNNKNLRVQYAFTYNSWSGARGRVINPNGLSWLHYGGRGIRMCDRWIDSFENFLKDMGPRPLGKTLDRINPDGHYELANCRWATPSEQSRNTRSRVRSFDSSEQKSLRAFIRSVAWG